MVQLGTEAVGVRVELKDTSSLDDGLSVWLSEVVRVMVTDGVWVRLICRLADRVRVWGDLVGLLDGERDPVGDAEVHDHDGVPVALRDGGVPVPVFVGMQVTESDNVPDRDSEGNDGEKVVGLKPESVEVGVGLLDNDAVDGVKDMDSDAEGERGLGLWLEVIVTVGVGGYVTDPVGVTLSLQLREETLMDPDGDMLGGDAVLLIEGD
mmetsp:Transcript_108072/g.186516  ORF Transcript_108072/g.186516 Transcript_108072/m.186516 type:complete len:208 (+) Transcript_108072:3140-3763(+)